MKRYYFQFLKNILNKIIRNKWKYGVIVLILVFMVFFLKSKCKNDYIPQAGLFKFPDVFDYIDHLKNQSSRIIKPRIALTKMRSDNNIVIGIPTVKRKKEDYLKTTLESLFEIIHEESDEIQNKLLVVIMIAEIDNDENVSEIINNLKNEYNAELESGLMDVIVPKKDFYPDFKSVEEDTIFHDPKDRIAWRKKQNYDYSYLMSYAYNRGDYYLQLEDDLITSPGFLQKIHKFIQKKESDQWIELDFTNMGFIGKMFHNRHLSILANYWIMYADIMPCDLLLEYWQRTMKCDPGGAWKTCLKTLKTAIGVYPENLWHHIGKESSLAGKVQKIKLTHFIEVTKNNNPKANISTTMTSSLNKFTFDKVYDGISIYRGETLNCESCYISIVFKEPLNLKKFRIKSGSSLYLSDTIPMNSLIQIKTVDTADSMPSFITIEKSKTKHISGIIDSKYGPVKEFRLSITSGYKNPIVIRDIKLEY